MADQISARRAATNNFLLTVNAFLVTLYGVASSFQPGAWLLAVAAAGFVVSLTWCALILSYKNLNSAKYAVIQEMERQLPAAPYTREWELARGADSPLSRYFP